MFFAHFCAYHFAVGIHYFGYLKKTSTSFLESNPTLWLFLSNANVGCANEIFVEQKSENYPSKAALLNRWAAAHWWAAKLL